MKMTFRAATPTERLYTYSQCAQLESQTGCISYLRGDMAGAFSGWASPEADPQNYDEQGNYIQPKQRDRGNAR